MKGHNRWAAVAAAAVTLAPVAALATPAQAASNGVTVSLTTSAPDPNGRTLVLENAAGGTLTGLDLSQGTVGFIAKVVDSNYAPNGFTLQSNMSNLYGYNAGTGTWNCSAKVSSAAVSLTSASSLLDASGLASSLTPQFLVSGDLSSVLSLLLGANSGAVSGSVQGLVQSLTQGQLAGGHTGDLVGSLLTTLASKLPIDLATGSGGAFNVPAADPTGALCGVSGANATSVPVMNGTANLTGLVSDLQALLTALPNTLTSTLVSNSFLDSASILTLVNQLLSIPLNLLSPLAASIEGALTGVLDSVPLISGLTSITGNYTASPKVSVDTSGVPSGSYRGTLTLTLADS